MTGWAAFLKANRSKVPRWPCSFFPDRLATDRHSSPALTFKRSTMWTMACRSQSRRSLSCLALFRMACRRYILLKGLEALGWPSSLRNSFSASGIDRIRLLMVRAVST